MLEIGFKAFQFTFGPYKEKRSRWMRRCYVVAENNAGRQQLLVHQFRRDEARHLRLSRRRGENRTGP